MPREQVLDLAHRNVDFLKIWVDTKYGSIPKISKEIRDAGFKKVQTQIQGDEIRVTSPSRDQLQEVIAFLKPKDYGVELMFGNFR